MARPILAPMLLITSFTLPAPLLAQDSDEDHYVETTGSEITDPVAPTGSVTDVDVEDSELSGEDLGDVIDQVPGVFVLRRSSFGQSAYASVRGGNPRQLSVSLAGVDLSIPAGLGFDVGSTSTFGLERARIYRGAAAIQQGSGSLTGAIDLVPSVPEEAGSRLEAHAMGGSFGTVATGATAAVGTKWVGISLGASRRRSRGDFVFEDDGEEVARINNDHERTTVFGTTRVDITSQDRWLTTARYGQGERGTAGPSEFQQTFADARAADSRAVVATRFDHTDVWTPFRYGTLDLYESFGAQWRNESFENDQTAIGSAEFRAESRYRSASANAGFYYYHDFYGLPWDDAVRFDYGYTDEDYRSVETGVFDSEIDQDRSTSTVNVSNEFIVWERFSLLAGLRFESVDGERDESAWLPFTGFLAPVADWLTIFGNAARTYRPPDFDELYLDSEILQGDPDLESERSTALDLGLRAGHDDASAELVFFQNDIENPIRFLPVNVFLSRAQNLDEYTARGAELSGSYRPFLRLLFEAGYTVTVASFAEVDAQVPGVPRHTARAGSRVELAGWIPEVERVQIGVDVRYRGEVNLDLFGNVASPAWADLGAHLRVTPVEWLDLRCTAQNLLDRRDVIDVLQQPLPGRTLYLSVAVKTDEP